MPTVTVTAGPRTATAAYTLPSPLKDALVGLVDRAKPPPATHAGAVRNVVIQPTLAALWPTIGVMDLGPARAAVAAAKAAGLDGCRLRVTTGKDAPAWLKTACGTYRVTQTGGASTYAYDCPRWWTPDYFAFHNDADAALAHAFDGDPFVREVTVWAVGTTWSSEPAIRQMSTPATVDALTAAGYTTAADLAACTAFVDAMAGHWAATRLHAWVPMGWQTLVGGKVRQDMAVSLAYARHLLEVAPGAVIGVDNADQVAYAADPTYAMVAGLGSLRADQTATWAKLGGTDAVAAANLLTTLADAAAAGVRSVELPAGYAAVPPDQLAAAAAALLH